jgi:hypothetical protein
VFAPLQVQLPQQLTLTILRKSTIYGCVIVPDCFLRCTRGVVCPTISCRLNRAVTVRISSDDRQAKPVTCVIVDL